MNKPELYRLRMFRDSDKPYVGVFRTDHNYGLQGYVFDDGSIRLDYTPYQIPRYVQRHALTMIHTEKEMTNTKQL